MLIDLKTVLAKNGVRPTGILHVGGHHGEELNLYRSIDRLMPVWWVEANPEAFARLERNLRRWPNHFSVGPVAIGDHRGEATLHVANRTMSSSLLPLGTHAVVHPEVHYTEDVVVTMDTIDHLATECEVRANVLVMDIQGGEGPALQGADRFLAGVDLVYLEVNAKALYEGCWLLPEMDSWLGFRGFEMRALMMEGATGWGDAVFVRA